MSERVIFARIGYMRYYAGSQLGDEKPIYGGKYTKKHIGNEVYNFKPVNGQIYRFFTPFLTSMAA